MSGRRRGPHRPGKHTRQAPARPFVADAAPIELTIERPVAGGRMLARHEGRVILVAGAIPGETVLARLERVERGVAFARVDAVLAPSPDRRPPTFDPACGGGVYAHVGPARQVDLKREVILDGVRRGAGLSWDRPLPVAASPEHGYRLRARLHVRGTRVGFFKEGTHVLCDAAPSGQLAADTLDAVQHLVDAVAPALPLDAVEVSENVDGSERAVHLHAMGDAGADRPIDAASLRGITGVSMAIRGTTPESSIARTPATLAGEPTVGDPLSRLVAGAPPDVHLRRHAASFFQGNRFLLGALAQAVVDAVPSSGPVWDLYAGVGLFAASLCSLGRDRVTAVEGDPISGADLRRNAATFGDRLAVEARSVEAVLAATTLPGDATVIVDPPRTGLSPAASAALAASAAGTIVYVSCDVATLARDLKILRAGGFEVASIAGFDLFPNTAHIESLVVLRRDS